MISLSSPTHAQDAGAGAAPPAGYDAIGNLVLGNAEIQSRYKVCPADIARTARPLWKSLWSSDEWAEERCEKDIEACHHECMEWRNESACFALGRAYEKAIPAVSSHLSQMLFAEACALGSRGGCTNRASGIRNAQYDGDPMLATDREKLASCYFRTFSFSCGDVDAWGCTMLGQSYQLGEGVAPDMDAAQRRYLQACEIKPDFPACDYARSMMQELGAGAE